MNEKWTSAAALSAAATAGSLVIMLAAFADARATLGNPAVVAAVGTAAALCAAFATRACPRALQLTDAALWGLWLAPAVAWVALGKYPIVDAGDLAIIAIAAGAPTTLPGLLSEKPEDEQGWHGARHDER